MMNLRRNAYKKPFCMRRYSTREDDMTKLIRNLIQMSEQNEISEDKINRNFLVIHTYLTQLAMAS